MDKTPRSGLRDCQILIVESEAQLLRELMRVLESEDAECVYITDPYGDAGAKRVGSYVVCAAVINSVHRSVAGSLDVPVLIYGAQTSVPLEAGAIVRALKGMLPPQ